MRLNVYLILFDDNIVHIVYILTSCWGCPSNSNRALSQVATFQNWNKFMSEDVPNVSPKGILNTAVSKFVQFMCAQEPPQKTRRLILYCPKIPG